MTDEQVWTDLERFAAAMKRGATVVMNNGYRRPCANETKNANGEGVSMFILRNYGGIREIIEPTQKRIRPLNAEEWRDVAGCVTDAVPPHWHSRHTVPLDYSDHAAKTYALAKATGHPAGFPNDIRKLWVEE